MNQRAILVIALLFVACLGRARGEPVTPLATVPPPPTKFFSTFYLSDLVKRHRALWKELCSGAGGGGGGAGFVAQAGKRQRLKSDGFGCRINETVGDKFKEREKALLEALKSDVEKQIAERGAKVGGAGGASPAGFYFEYSEGEVKGEIKFVSGRKGDDYHLNVELAEEGKD